MDHYFQKEEFQCDFPIDLVCTWVDDSDVNWRQKKDSFLRKSSGLPVDAVENRYDNHNELKYSLRSIARYMPWIHHIYIVTDHQIPPFLELDNPKISIVDHTEIYDDPAVLPTFNSNSIEWKLPFIPGLSEHFIYTNDDVFVCRPLNPSFFFTDEGTPIVRVVKSRLFSEHPHWFQDGVYKDFYASRTFQWEHWFLHINKLFYDYFGKEYGYVPWHGIDAYRKSSFLKVLEEPLLKDEIRDTVRSRFRGEKQLVRLAIALMDNVRGRNVLLDKQTLKIQEDGSYPICELQFIKSQSCIDTLLNGPLPYQFCIGCNPDTQASFKRSITSFLESVYPEPCEYEKNAVQMSSELAKMLVRNDVLPAFPENNVPVVLTADDESVDYLYVLIKSIAVRLSGNLDALVIVDDLSAKSAAFITEKVQSLENVKLRFVDIHRYVVYSDLALLGKSKFPVTSIYRLLAPEIFVHYDKLLCLDTDVVCHGDLSELFRLDLGDQYAGAVTDEESFVRACEDPAYATFAEANGFRDAGAYVNAGVLLLNAEAFRHHALWDAMLALACRDDNGCPVRDALNFICRGHVKRINPKWNLLIGNYWKFDRDAPLEASLFHFAGIQKPWGGEYCALSHLWWNELDTNECQYFTHKMRQKEQQCFDAERQKERRLEVEIEKEKMHFEAERQKERRLEAEIEKEKTRFEAERQKERRLEVEIEKERQRFEAEIEKEKTRFEAERQKERRLEAEIEKEKTRFEAERQKERQRFEAEIEKEKTRFDAESQKATLYKERLRRRDRKLRELQSSVSFRLGRAITWPLRMVRNTFRCLSENGFVYTLSRIPAKFLAMRNKIFK